MRTFHSHAGPAPKGGLFFIDPGFSPGLLIRLVINPAGHQPGRSTTNHRSKRHPRLTVLAFRGVAGLAPDKRSRRRRRSAMKLLKCDRISTRTERRMDQPNRPPGLKPGSIKTKPRLRGWSGMQPDLRDRRK